MELASRVSSSKGTEGKLPVAAAALAGAWSSSETCGLQLQVRRRLTPESSLKAEELDICMAAATEQPCSPPGDAFGMRRRRRQPQLGRLQRHHERLVRDPGKCQQRGCAFAPGAGVPSHRVLKTWVLPTIIQSLVHSWCGGFWKCADIRTLSLRCPDVDQQVLCAQPFALVCASSETNAIWYEYSMDEGSNLQLQQALTISNDLFLT